MLLSLTDQHGDGRLKPGINLIDGLCNRGRRVEYPGMGRDSQKLMDTGPGQTPADTTVRQRFDAGLCTVVPLGVSPMCVHENIGVGGNQLPRPA